MLSISIESGSISTPNEADDLVEIDATFLNLIPSRFPPVALFQRIANNRDDDVAQIESLTNPRLREKERLLSSAAAVDLESPLVQNWNHAPFTYLNPEGSRFFGPNVAVLELADELQTALAISVGKRELFLSRTTENMTGLDMRVLSRRVRGRFVDGSSQLDASDPAGLRAVGRSVLNSGADGILFRPAERPSARCLAILNGETLDRAIQGEHFRFIWDGARISSLYSFNTGEVIEPDQLQLAGCVLAA
jgi:hypothetical protein